MESTAALLAWYDANRRPLPWRGDRSPYEIWVSEIMLQQTRVETVLPFYARFLARFPTVSALAAASEEEVLALWSGLGYYRRARSLHAAARQVEAAGGEVPSSAEELRRLPGVGPYTAAAIASLAFGLPEPVLDGNVERVLSRYRRVGEPVRSAAGKRRLLGIARDLLDRDRPGDFNQALMELGARVCTPRTPDCPSCPLAVDCEALSRDDVAAYPARTERRPPRKEARLLVVVRSRGKLLMSRRSADSERMPAMWELPWTDATTEPEEALAQRYGGRWAVGPASGRVRHSITSRSLEVAVHSATWLPSEVAENGSLRWIDEGRLNDLPMSSLVGKALAEASAPRSPGAPRR